MEKFNELIAKLKLAQARRIARQQAQQGGAQQSMGPSQVPVGIPGMEVGPQADIGAQELLIAINNNPQVLQQILEQEAELAQDNPDDFVGVQTDDDYMAELATKYTFLPREMTLRPRDYTRIKQYFTKGREYRTLTDHQQNLLETLRYDSVENFTVESGNFQFGSDGVKYYNLREQLLGKLEADGVLTKDTALKLGNQTQSFADGAKTWDYSFIPDGTKATTTTVEPAGGGKGLDASGRQMPSDVQMAEMSGASSFWGEDILKQLYKDNPGLENDRLAWMFEKTDKSFAEWRKTMPDNLRERYPRHFDIWDNMRMEQAKANDTFKIMAKDMWERHFDPDKEYGDWNNEDFLLEAFDAPEGQTFEDFLTQRGWQRSDFSELFWEWDNMFMEHVDPLTRNIVDDDDAPKMPSQEEIEMEVFGKLPIDEGKEADLGDVTAGGDHGIKSFEVDGDITREESFGLKQSTAATKLLQDLDARYPGWSDEFSPLRGMAQREIDIFKRGEAAGEGVRVSDLDVPDPNQISEPAWLNQEGLPDIDPNDVSELPGFLDDPDWTFLKDMKDPVAPFQHIVDSVDDPAIGQEILNNMTALDSSGNMYLNVLSYKHWADKLTDAVKFAGPMWGLNQLMGLVDPTGQLQDWVNIGLVTADFLATGNPLFAAVTGIQKLVSELDFDNKRKIENRTPYSGRGKRWGYVRGEGSESNEWFPAYIADKLESPYFLTRDANFQMVYGTDLLWIRTGTSSVEPFFRDGRIREFSDHDEVLTDKTNIPGKYADTYMSSKEWHDHRDPMRDWYLLTPGEQSNMFKDPRVQNADGMTFDKFVNPDPIDNSSDNYYMQTMEDWRKIIGYMNEVKYKDVKAKIGEAAHVSEFSTTKGLREVTTTDKNTFMSLYIADDAFEGQTQDQILETMQRTDRFGENEYMYKGIVKQQILDLVTAQKSAAIEAGYKNVYGADPFFQRHYNDPVNKAPMQEWKMILPESGTGERNYYRFPQAQTSWSAKYLDFNHDIPTAESADTLFSQIESINNYDDVGPSAMNYLVQKAITRYWINQTGIRGQGTNLVRQVLGPLALSSDRDDGISRYLTQGSNTTIYFSHDAMPWANKEDQNSIIPNTYYDDIHTEGHYDTWIHEREKQSQIDTTFYDTHFNESTNRQKSVWLPIWGDIADFPNEKEPQKFEGVDNLGTPGQTSAWDDWNTRRIAYEAYLANLNPATDQAKDHEPSHYIRDPNDPTQSIVNPEWLSWSLGHHIDEPEFLMTPWGQKIPNPKYKSQNVINPHDYSGFVWDPATTFYDLNTFDATIERKVELAVEHWGGNADDWNVIFSGNTGEDSEEQYNIDDIGWGKQDVGHVVSETEGTADLPSGYYYANPMDPYSMIYSDDGSFAGSLTDMWNNIESKKTWQPKWVPLPDDKKKDKRTDAEKSADRIQKKAARDKRKADAAAQQQASTDAAAQQQADTDDAAQQQAATDDADLTAVQQYIKDFHPLEFDPSTAITPEIYPWMAFTGQGNPALGGDSVLEQNLGLPDHIQAIQTQQGVIHESFDSRFVMPAFSSIQNTGHAITVP